MPAGVVKEVTSEDKCYYTAKDIQEMLGVGRDKSYKMIRELKDALIAQGYLFPGLKAGTIPKWLFRKAYMLDDVDMSEFQFNLKNEKTKNEKVKKGKR